MLGDLFAELDSLAPRPRLQALVQGVLAANIFDWGAQACVNLYHEGTILELYQQARHDLAQRPWRVDDYDALEAAWLALESRGVNEHGTRSAHVFVAADLCVPLVPCTVHSRGGAVVRMVLSAVVQPVHQQSRGGRRR